MFSNQETNSPDNKKQFMINILSWIAVILLVGGLYLWKGCPIKYFTGVSCPGCGMTRAAISVAHLDFKTAAHMHPLVFMLPLPALLLIKKRPGILAKPFVRNAILGIFCVSMIGVYIYRMFFGDGSVVNAGIPAFIIDVQNISTLF